jgi:hypothetical protein
VRSTPGQAALVRISWSKDVADDRSYSMAGWKIRVKRWAMGRNGRCMAK